MLIMKTHETNRILHIGSITWFSAVRCRKSGRFDAEGKGDRYTINFYRSGRTADWYDEIRYDSHEIRRGKILTRLLLLELAHLSGCRVDQEHRVSCRYIDYFQVRHGPAAALRQNTGQYPDLSDPVLHLKSERHSLPRPQRIRSASKDVPGPVVEHHFTTA